MTTKMIVRIGLGCGAALMMLTPQVLAEGPCTKCGPGANWIDTCEAGEDLIPASAVQLGIDLAADDCTPDLSLVFSGEFTVSRGVPADGVIEAEIVEMVLSSPDGTTLIAGAGLGQGGVLAASTGSVTEDAGDNTIGHAVFDLFFEIELPGDPGFYYYNHTAFRMEADIACVPPTETFKPLDPCVLVYDAPLGVRGAQVMYQVTESEDVVEEEIPHIVVRPTVECDGAESEGTGEVDASCPAGTRMYAYPVTDPTGTVTDIFIGTDDCEPAHYSAWCEPAGWSHAVQAYEPGLYHSPDKTPHGLVGPAYTAMCPCVIHWWGPAAGTPGWTFTFGFNSKQPSHDVEWRVVDAIDTTRANRHEPVGMGEGPVHGPTATIPAVTEWGLVVMALLVIAAGTVVLRRARALRSTA